MLSQFNKCSFIHPRLRKFSSRKAIQRPRTKTPVIDNSLERSNRPLAVSGNKVSQFTLAQAPKSVEQETPSQKSIEKVQEVNETEQTTPSSKHSTIIGTNEK